MNAEEVREKINANLASLRVNAGFGRPVYVFGEGGIKKFYSPQVLRRPGYFNVSGYIGLLPASVIGDGIKRGISSEDSLAIYLANISDLSSAGYMDDEEVSERLPRLLELIQGTLSGLPDELDELSLASKTKDNPLLNQILSIPIRQTEEFVGKWLAEAT